MIEAATSKDHYEYYHFLSGQDFPLKPIDEFFLQTVYLNSGDRFKRYTANCCEKHPYIQDTYFDVCRAIDWTRGNPYIYTNEDIPMLMESGCLFARKFDFTRDPELLKAIKYRIDAAMFEKRI